MSIGILPVFLKLQLEYSKKDNTTKTEIWYGQKNKKPRNYNSKPILKKQGIDHK